MFDFDGHKVINGKKLLSNQNNAYDLTVLAPIIYNMVNMGFGF